jgi:hypothetical protein
MSLDAATQAAIKTAVKEALAEVGHDRCACGLSPEHQAEMGHMVGMVRDLGEGDLSRGVESMRQSLQFVPALIRVRNRVGTWALSVIVLSLTAGALGLIWHGLLSKVGATK